MDTENRGLRKGKSSIEPILMTAFIRKKVVTSEWKSATLPSKLA
jgi:hypothetical protein